MIPAWVSRKGLLEHAGAGLGVTLALGWWLAPGLVVVLVLAGGVLHELWDGDLTCAPGAPGNGLLDVAAFLPAPLAWWALAGLLT